MMTSVRPARRRRRGETGATFIEVLFGATFLVVGVLGLSLVSVSSAQLRKVVTERSVAEHALAEEVRAIETTPFDQILAVHNGRGFDVIADGAVTGMLEPLPGDADGLPGLVTVTVPDPPNDPSVLLEVTVALSWQGVSGTRTISRSLRVSRLGGS